MGQGENLATYARLRNRVPKGAFERLEAVKSSKICPFRHIKRE